MKSVDSDISLHNRSHALMFPLQPNSIKGVWSDGKQDVADNNQQMVLIAGEIRIKAVEHFLFRSF